MTISNLGSELNVILCTFLSETEGFKSGAKHWLSVLSVKNKKKLGSGSCRQAAQSGPGPLESRKSGDDGRPTRTPQVLLLEGGLKQGRQWYLQQWGHQYPIHFPSFIPPTWFYWDLTQEVFPYHKEDLQLSTGCMHIQRRRLPRLPLIRLPFKGKNIKAAITSSLLISCRLKKW